MQKGLRALNGAGEEWAAESGLFVPVFTEDEEQQKVAAMCSDTIPKLSGKEAEEKALQETILRVKQNSIAWQTEHMDPGDMWPCRN